MILLSHLIANRVYLYDDLLVLAADLFALGGKSCTLLTCCAHLSCHVFQLMYKINNLGVFCLFCNCKVFKFSLSAIRHLLMAFHF